MAFYRDEAPSSGVINGVNTVFTFAHTIYQLNFIEVDGAPYFGAVSILGDEITFTDAPTLSVHISYYDVEPLGTSSNDGATVQEAIDRMVRYYNYDLQATNGGEVSFTLFLDWLNDLNYMAYEQMFRVDPSKYWKYAEYTVTNVAKSFLQPTDIKSFRPAPLGMHKMDTNNNFTGKIVDEISLGEVDDGYYRDGSNIVFTDRVEPGTYRFYYVPKLAPLDEATDKLVIDIENIDAILDWLDKKYGKWNIDITRENNADQRFAIGFNRIINNYSPSAKYFVL